MGWRGKMEAKTANKNLNPIRNIRNKSNIQEKESEKHNIADIGDIAPGVQEIKSNTPPPDTSKIQPEHVQRYSTTHPERLKKISGLPEHLFQAPAVRRPGDSTDQTNQEDHRDTCRACGERQWWRKNEPRSKSICGRCHPPAPGLDVIWMNER